MRTGAGGGAASVHVLKVTLRDVSPAVWRRLEVPSAITLGELHDVLQVAFDWSDDHLHAFRARGVDYEPGGPGRVARMFGEPARDEDAAVLGRVVPRPGDELDYVYDFGDDWRHRLVVEGVSAARPDAVYPVCTAGAGLPPREDVGGPRRGGFGEAALRAINGRLRPVAGRDLPVEAVVDPHFGGLFPDLDLGGVPPGTCPCGCGEASDAGVQPPLPVLRAAPAGELAEAAASSPLARQALALASWVGAGRVLTPSGLLRPGDAVRAVADLGLDADDWSVEPTGSSDVSAPAGRSRRPPERCMDGPVVDVLPLFGEEADADAVAGDSAPARKVRSAKDLPSLHPLWLGCLAAGLVQVRAGKAYPGPGLVTWQHPAEPEARLEVWCALLGGQLRARDDAVRGNRDAESRIRAEIQKLGAPMLYGIAAEPVPVAALALSLANLEELQDYHGYSMLHRLPVATGELRRILDDWAGAGVVDRGTASDEVRARTRESLDELRAEVAQRVELTAAGPAGRERAEALRRDLTSALDDLGDGAAVRVTPLGAYGLARLLEAHGWRVPRSGDSAACAPQTLLDELARYLPPDVPGEALSWLDAQGAQWQGALREVVRSAGVRGDEGPARRAVLPLVLLAAGERARPVLDAAPADPWLAPVLSVVRHAWKAGPPPSPADLMWLAVDLLTPFVDDDEDFAAELEESPLPDLLAQPGAVAVAVGLKHPGAPAVLRAAALLLEDPQTAGALRSALSGRSGNPAPRGRTARRRGTGTRRR